MRARKLLRLSIVLTLVLGTAATAQTRLCSTVPLSQREVMRSVGACRDSAPIVDLAPRPVEPQRSVVVAVPGVVGLGFDDARDRLAGFSVRRSYRPSAEPGGTVLEQQPAPASRLAAGAIVRLVLSDGTLRPPPRVTAAEIDGVANPVATQTDARPAPPVTPNTSQPGQMIEQSPAGAAAQSASAMPLPRTTDGPGIDLVLTRTAVAFEDGDGDGLVDALVVVEAGGEGELRTGSEVDGGAGSAVTVSPIRYTFRGQRLP